MNNIFSSGRKLWSAGWFRWTILFLVVLTAGVLVWTYTDIFPPEIEEEEEVQRGASIEWGTEERMEITEFPVVIEGDEVTREVFEGILSFDRELAVLYDLPFDYFALSQEGYWEDVVGRVVQRVVLEHMAREFSVDGTVSDDDIERLSSSFPFPGSLETESARKERLARIREIVLSERLDGIEKQYDLTFYFVKVYGSGAGLLKEEGVDVDKVAREKAVDVCEMVRKGSSLEEVREFMIEDETIMSLNDNTLPRTVVGRNPKEIGKGKTTLWEEVSNLAEGEIGETVSFEIEEEGRGMVKFGYGCVDLKRIKGGVVDDWRSDLEKRVQAVDIKETVP